MPDKVLVCQNCHSPFVYSEYEQLRDSKEKKEMPFFCPICTAIKNSAKARPAKPPKPLA